MKKIHLFIFILSTICIILVASLFLTKGCSHETEKPAVDTVRIDTLGVMLTQIQRCSRLNTAEVKVHKIITHDDITNLSGKLLGKEISIDLPTGKRKVAIPLYATIKASIDMGKVTDQDIVRDGDKIEIFLPQPDVSITETHIDHDGVRQYVAITRSNFSDAELQSYEKKGREAIQKDIPKLGIKEMARESAARQLVPIMQLLGFKDSNITISFRTDGKDNKIIRRTN